MLDLHKRVVGRLRGISQICDSSGLPTVGGRPDRDGQALWTLQRPRGRQVKGCISLPYEAVTSRRASTAWIPAAGSVPPIERKNRAALRAHWFPNCRNRPGVWQRFLGISGQRRAQAGRTWVWYPVVWLAP